MDEGPDDATERVETKEARQRDEKGRFLARPEVATEPQREGDPAKPAVEPAPEPPQDPNAPAVFKFAGEEFASQEAAEQNFKSLRGQFKPLNDAAHGAAESARAWKAEAEKAVAQRDALVAELNAVKAVPQSQPAAKPAEVPAEAAPSIDWALYAEIRKQADATGEPWKAEQWLHEQNEAVLKAREEKLREELSEPQRKAEARRQVGQKTEQLFSSLAEYVNEDGSVAYPELRDPDQAYQVGKFWASMGLPTEYALTPQGAIAAIGMYRMASKQGAAVAAEAAAAAGSQGSPAPTAPTPDQVAAEAAANLVGGKPTVQVSPMDSTMSPEAARVLQGLKDTKLTQPGLGFEA
jgi:hypothetical protein